MHANGREWGDFQAEDRSQRAEVGVQKKEGSRKKAESVRRKSRKQKEIGGFCTAII